MRSLKEWIGRAEEAAIPPGVRLRVFEKTECRGVAFSARYAPGFYDQPSVWRVALPPRAVIGLISVVIGAIGAITTVTPIDVRIADRIALWL